jgi:hypothetical protein
MSYIPVSEVHAAPVGDAVKISKRIEGQVRGSIEIEQE